MLFYRRSWRATGCLLLAATMLLPAAIHSSAQAADERAAVRDYNAAAALQNSGLYERAAERWAAYLKAYPNDKRLDQAQYHLGVCQLHAKKYDEAAANFQTVLTKYPAFEETDAARYNLGMALFQRAAQSNKAEDFRKAAEALGDAAAKHPQSKYADKAVYFQGEALVGAGDLEAAVQSYQKLIATYGNSPLQPDACYALGVTQQELKQHAQAADSFNRFLANQAWAKHDLAGEVRMRLGMALFDQGKHAEAEPHFAALAEMKEFPHADFVLLRQGQCKLETGKAAEAAALLATLPQKFPKSQYKSAAQLAAGKCAYLADKLDQAQQALAPLAGGNGPEAAEAAYWLGRTLLKQAKASEALAALDSATKKHTDGPFVPYLQLARIDAMYDLPDRRKDTPPLYEAFVKSHPDHLLAPQALYMAALSALGQQNYTAARTHAEAFLANAKYADHELTHAVLFIAAEAHLLGADAAQPGSSFATAEQLYQRLIEKYPKHANVPRAQVRIGWCRYQMKKYDEAVRHLGSVLAALQDPADKAETNLLLGQLHAQAGRHREAVAACRAAYEAKRDWPRADEVLLVWAQSHQALGELDQAAAQLGQLGSQFPNSPLRAQADYLRGEIAQDQKKYDEAIARYQELLSQSPKDALVPAARYRLAAACYAKGDYARALESLNAVLSGQAEAELAGRARYLRGLVYQHQKQFQPALTDLEAFLATKPPVDEALDARCAAVLCRIGLKQLDQARTAAAELLRERPDYPHVGQVYYELGHGWLEQKKAVEAAEAFRTLAEKLPESSFAAEAWFHVGRFHEDTADQAKAEPEKMAEMEKAAAAYASGLAKAKEPELREKLQFKLGDTQFRRGQFDKAAATLQSLLAEFPAGSLKGPARFLAAESLFRQKQFDKALPLFVQVANEKVEPYHAQSLYRAGACAEALEKWSESQGHYDALIRQFPQFDRIQDARCGLALALQKQKRLAEARSLFQQVSKEAEGETAARAHFMLGEIAFAEGKHLDAVEEYLLVAVGYPYQQWQALAQFEAGRCLVELGKKDQAVKAFESFVKQFPDHPKAKDAAMLLQELRKP